MRKKICYLLLLMLIIPINAKAFTGSIEIKCDKESYNASDTATCKVTGSSDDEVTSVHAIVNKLSNADISFVKDKIWEGSNDIEVDLYTDEVKKDTFNIGVLTIKLKDKISDDVSINLKIDDIKFGDKSFQEHDIKLVEKKIKFTSIKQNKEEKKDNGKVKNPNTSDNILSFVIIGGISLVGVLTSLKSYMKRKGKA